VPFAVGFVGMYVAYEVVHRRLHTHRGVGAVGRYLRRHHFHHHFGNPRLNHGVTSPIWDVVFGTFQAPGVITVPEKLAMDWLVDPQTGDVHEDLATLWRLRRAAA
jgi:sterol desaturase/sphingolipid hydroxylase (fatty acid hydroxylase superfamily)